MILNAIPLALYVHIPWCVQKCPYCDFNSHTLKGGIPESEYIAHLLDDLSADLPLVSHNGQLREVTSIFIGGGTPSLLSVEAMHKLIEGIKARIPVHPQAEISMEANPGTVESDKFIGFQASGVNRISIGVQSFQASHLKILGRIHNEGQAHNAIELAKSLALRSFNTDLMHGLPEQSLENALSDLQQAIDHAPPHLSWYQLTIEPNTLFYSKPPELPIDDVLWDIQTQGQALLAQHGYEQYEVSAYAKPGQKCAHNLNYWRFGDYLGIGCGAHGKISNLSTGEIIRTVKVKHPKGYMDLSKPYMQGQTAILDEDMGFEFFMNRLRLIEACPHDEFERYTGRALTEQEKSIISKLNGQGLMLSNNNEWRLSELGKRHLNTVLAEFV
ncbi:radical SAM family heme chaperone HemW [Glaciecola sp. 2405UD65-10]|uniref:radical SAM family heme chaperone HemW n=1 Tax=Glaciecola sp. 2405UD65-10 TaxID=3397244 RepID=UPI003B59B9B9